MNVKMRGPLARYMEKHFAIQLYCHLDAERIEPACAACPWGHLLELVAEMNVMQITPTKVAVAAGGMAAYLAILTALVMQAIG
jgi:hypothetical protein